MCKYRERAPGASLKTKPFCEADFKNNALRNRQIQDAPLGEGVSFWDRSGVKLATANVGDNSPDVSAEEVQDTTSERHDHVVNGLKEAGTLTDVCNSNDLPEVEIFSLLEDQIPQYVLRAETITDFYTNSDWIQYPCLPATLDLDLTPELIQVTLDYFVSCGDRLSQMTKTYNDIEAVTRLLEEKERDLELAARIGQTLLDRNKSLCEKNDQLEAELAEANEQVFQLKHELTLKDNLLHLYTADEYTETDEDGSPVTRDKHYYNITLSNLEGLQRKVAILEDENLQFKSESSRLQLDTLNFEEKEQLLVKDCVSQLSETNEQLKFLSDELSTKSDVNLRQQEEITNLLGKNINLESKVKRLTNEVAELHTHLGAAQDAQRELTTELAELKDKYSECLALLHESNEELKLLRRKHRPSVTRQVYSTFSPFLPSDSLASELENEFRKDFDFPAGCSPSERRAHNWRVMQTARAIKKSRQRTSSHDSLNASTSLASFQSTTSGNESCESIAGSSNRSSLYLSESESFMSDGYTGDVDSTYGSSCNLGRHGVPGSNDLETALRQLQLRRSHETHNASFGETSEDDRQRFESEGTATPTPCRTPDSMFSTGSGLSDFSRLSGVSNYSFRMPEKLQIVKPIEGSATLHQWQRLATPHLGGLLDDRPGVSIKGERKLDGESETYHLSDYEEDGMCTTTTDVGDGSSTLSPPHNSHTCLNAFGMASLLEHDNVLSDIPISSPRAVIHRWTNDAKDKIIVNDEGSQDDNLGRPFVLDKLNEHLVNAAVVDKMTTDSATDESSILQRYAGNVALAGGDLDTAPNNKSQAKNKDACVIS